MMRKWMLAGTTLFLAPWMAQGAEQCAALSKFEMANVSITSAASQTAGTLTLETGQKIPGLPAFCRVVGVATPTPQSKIGFEVWLPEQNWSGRYVQAGNGGLAGVIFHPVLAQLLQRGHATASTDNGHQASPIDGTWAIGQPEKVRDFAERAVHVTSDIAKALVAQFYAKPAQRSYFFGCSEGGREALIAAQRYPEAFDGIVAGAPASDWTNLMTGFVWRGQALHGSPEGFIPESKLPLIQVAAMKACDAKDGVEDGLVSDASCRFDPRELECRGSSTDQCLTKAQLSSLERLYSDLRDPKTNMVISPGYVPSGENETGPIGGGVRQYAFGAAPGQSLQVAFSTGYFGGFVFERRDWDFRSFDLTRDVATAREKLGTLMDATDPDLTKLRKHGVKLLQYHGLLDGSIPPAMSTHYFDRVQARMGNTQDYYRLFLAPGVLHCGFGPGPNVFGNLGSPGKDAEHDTLFALERWVEQGVAPASIIATKYTDDDPRKPALRTRPLCPYPQVAKWDGKGDVDRSESFKCAAAAPKSSASTATANAP